MAYSEKEIENVFTKIIDRIENGESLRSVLRDENMPSSQTFYIWVDNDPLKSKQYARATQFRADTIFDEMFDIADDGSNDYTTQELGDGVEVQKVNNEHIQRSRLRIDTRKWALSKMNPKKYGDKIDINSENTNINIELTPEERAAKIAALKAKL